MEALDESYSLRRRDCFFHGDVGRSQSSRMLLESSISSDTPEIITEDDRSLRSRSLDDHQQWEEAAGQQKAAAVWRILKHPFAKTASNAAKKAAKDAVASASKEEGQFMSLDVENRSSPMKKRTEKEKKSNRSSWLPDPERRWPVQGW